MKMFIKRKTRAGKAYDYQKLVNFKMLVTFKHFFNLTPDDCVGGEATFFGHNSIVRCPVLIFRPVEPNMAGTEPVYFAIE